MRIGDSTRQLWSREEQSWVERPWTWKSFAFLSVPLLISATIAADDSPWLAAAALLVAAIDLTLAGLAYRASRGASAADKQDR
ncbi:hypothetical protein GCM10023339_24600 [Alloalcanivorax gelatiniphagus]